MGRLLILLFLVLGAGLYFPTSRERILETARPLARPALAWMTNQELRQIVEDLTVELGSRGRLPTQRGEFETWMARRYPQERSRLDAWGTPYRLEVLSDRFRVISAGEDLVFGTEDDLFREGMRTSDARGR